MCVCVASSMSSSKRSSVCSRGGDGQGGLDRRDGRGSSEIGAGGGARPSAVASFSSLVRVHNELVTRRVSSQTISLASPAPSTWSRPEARERGRGEDAGARGRVQTRGRRTAFSDPLRHRQKDSQGDIRRFWRTMGAD